MSSSANYLGPKKLITVRDERDHSRDRWDNIPEVEGAGVGRRLRLHPGCLRAGKHPDHADHPGADNAPGPRRVPHHGPARSGSGALSCLLYLALGAIGLPVFSGAESGIGQLIGPTGGYLVSFPLAVFAGGLLAKDTGSSRRSELIRISSAMAVTLAIVYAVGVLWLSVLYLHGDVYEGVILGAAPFLPFDILKAVVAIPISLRVRGAGLGLPVNSPKRRAPNATTTTMVPVPDRPPASTGRD